VKELSLATANLSLAQQGDDVARLHEALQTLGRDIPVDELTRRVVGPITVAVVKALQSEAGLPASGMVDAKTLAAINAALSEAQKAGRLVRGRVLTADGVPAKGLTVQAYLQTPGKEVLAGRSALDAEGGYSISYHANAKLARTDLRLEVRGARAVVETSPPAGSILADAGALEVVDFALSGSANAPSPGIARVLADLTPLIGERKLAELDDVSLLGVQSGRSTVEVASLARASRLAVATKIPVDVFYGLLSQGLPADLDALRATHPQVLKGALSSAVAEGTVPEAVGGRKLEDYLPDLVPAPDTRLKNLFGKLLKPQELARFTDLYLKDAEPEKFWKAVAADPTLASRAEPLKLTVQLATLTESHTALVTKVLARGDISRAEDLARLTDADWTTMVSTTDVGVPAGTPGADDVERARNYVAGIQGRVEAAFPTPFFAARLGNTPVGKFLATNPSFGLKTSSLAAYLKDHPGAAPLGEADQKELAGYQRLYRITDGARDTQALAAKGFDSAHKIARMSREKFIASSGDVLAGTSAALIHDRASQASAMALAVFNEHAAALNRTGLPALPRIDVDKQAMLAAQAIPDWRGLFGAFDACACEECASVHSAAAYFVDILEFLEERGARAALFARRPDLGDIELSCANTNTPLPLVDLATEILEDTVAPPPPFAAFTLAPALQADLEQSVASEALRAAFVPPLASGTRVEMLEPAKRWRILDEAWAFSVVVEQGGALKVATRSRQTRGSADERRAVPQYRNDAAYEALKAAVFPSALPFDRPAEVARVFLAHLGVSRRELIGSLFPAQSLAAEGLGLAEQERKIIAGEALTPAVSASDFWDGKQPADLAKVQALLDAAGISYAQLEALLATRFVSPGGTLSIVPDSADVDSCDTARHNVQGLDGGTLDRLHRFLRLQRKLGWESAPLDKAICVLSANPAQPTLDAALLVKLDHLRALAAQWRMPAVSLLALWRPIDTAAPGSQYESMFYNPAVFKAQEEDFRLRPDGQELVHTDKRLDDHASTLQAVFRLDPAALALLSGRTDGALTLANLSFIYRHATLAAALRLKVQDLLIAVELTGLDPFQPVDTLQSARFVEAVIDIQKSGFEVARLDYLLRHRCSSAAPFVPTDLVLGQTLTDMRAAMLQAEAPAPADLQKLRESAATDRVAAALDLSADVAGKLLQLLAHDGTPALQVMLALLAGDTMQPVTRANAQPQFEALEKLHKIADVVDTLALPASQLAWLFGEMPTLAVAPDPQATPVGFESWFALIQFARLRREFALEPAAIEAILGALSGIAVTTDAAAQAAAKRRWADALTTWLGWSPADLQVLIGKPDDPNDAGLLQAQWPAGYRMDLLVRLNRVMRNLKRLGVDAGRAAQWCEPEVSTAHANAIRDAAKARYDEAGWYAVLTPLQDALRDRQRDALVAYLGARAGGEDLFARFLVDVEMSSCQLTSRIKLAIGSVQLYAQRCLMGIEPGIETSDPAWLRWNGWMKNYRVWEANRKIWLYPENWLDPELRSDKSPFCRELESELMQSQLDNDAAEQALMRYLQKLDEVAQLEIAGTYEDADKNQHVFGRTHHAPRTYYYRRRDALTATWTPWEKIEADIEGDHLIPVVWNRKLLVIWPVFTLKQDEKPAKMPPAGGSLENASKHWEIQLAWSEYQYGRWSGKYLSDAVRFEAWLGRPNILFGDYHARPGFMARPNTTGPGNTLPQPLPPAPTPPGGGGSTATNDVLTPVPGEMLFFKAFASESTLRVRCYLRLDYSGAGAGPAVAFPFGEFRFTGCRKFVTAAYRAQLSGVGFALAPKATIFERMWMDSASSGLTLLDGSFTTRPDLTDTTVLAEVNERTPLPEDPSATNARRIDIPVLGSSPSAYRLLAPHQDEQFLGDRPFFYMDTQRVFVVSSTGSSHLVTNPFTWVTGDLATLGLAAMARVEEGAPAPALAPVSTGALTVLERGVAGTRVARQLNTFDLAPVSSVIRLFPRYWSDRAYTFRNFHHAYACQFVQRLDRSGIATLLSLEAQSLADEHSFDGYAPKPCVTQAYPIDEVEFRAGGAYELYNWELFFHIPLLIATRLSREQRFEEAQRWFHYIFDPTGSAGGTPPQPYWRIKPFHERLAADYEEESVANLEELAATGAPEELIAAVKVWREHPFDPYAVARLRTTAFQKTVVMKYLDNLITWGDQRFRGETIESINEATLLYVLAAEILGRRPESIRRKVRPAVQTYNSLGATGLLGNALEQVELLIADAGNSADSGSEDSSALADPPKVLYFCVQENDKLLGYWNTVADRLFKIRHCMNIEGQVRQLPLFEPPIDPALLVRAAAAGVRIGDALSDLAAPLPNYRFGFVLQKANELAGEVRGLGAALLAALEKNDAEALSTLRSGQELRLNQAVREVRARQVEEAATSIEALEKSREMAQARLAFFQTREVVNAQENESLTRLSASLHAMETGAALRKLAAILHLVGAIKLGSPTTAGIEIGGTFVGNSLLSTASALDVAASLLSVSSQLSGRRAEYGRRKEEWDHQANVERIDLQQIDRQIIAAQLRLEIANRELINQERQIDNSRGTDEFLRGKFTNQDLYQWMIGQVSGLHFQSYQLAYDLAKRAERCLQHELGLAYGETSYIRFGYWDSLRKGLLAGDLLAHDLRRLEAAYLERNVREYELTKHVSLLSLAPERLIALKETGACEFSIPEWLFDLDTPGHYRRRIKMVSVTIPCVTGPFTGIHCKVQLLKNSYRQNADLAAGYERVSSDPANPDLRFIDDRKVLEAFVTSSGQNDAGLFEPSMRDERFLPFEGAGAVSTWRLELPAEFQAFDYGTISDVILQLRFTARDDGALRTAATASVKALLADAAAKPLLRLFSLRHEFPTEWYRFTQSGVAAPATLTLDLGVARFPYFAQGRQILIREAKVIARSTTPSAVPVVVWPGATLPPASTDDWTGQQAPGVWTLQAAGDPKTLENVFVLLAYTI
jgi:hypothetical protein